MKTNIDEPKAPTLDEKQRHAIVTIAEYMGLPTNKVVDHFAILKMCGYEIVEIDELRRLREVEAIQPSAWMVERDVDYESREFFLSEAMALHNASLGIATTHVSALIRKPKG